MQDKMKALKAALPHTIPVFAGFMFLGIAYGILMSSKGYGAIWSFLMSAIAFCGSMQFVAVTLLTCAFDPVTTFFMALMVNARHLFYGISMLSKYRGIGKLKFFLIFTLCDESFSVNYSAEPPEGVDKSWFYFFISILNYSYWVIGSTLGGLMGDFIKFNTKGLEFALTALFVVIFVNQWKEKKNRVPALIGVICSIIALMTFGKDDFIIPAMISILAVLTVLRRKLEGVKEVCA